MRDGGERVSGGVVKEGHNNLLLKEIQQNELKQSNRVLHNNLENSRNIIIFLHNRFMGSIQNFTTTKILTNLINFLLIVHMNQGSIINTVH